MDTTRPILYGNPAANSSGAYLASHPRSVTLEDGRTRVIVSAVKPPPAGETYYLDAARQQIALKEALFGVKLTNPEQSTVIDSMRRAAGMSAIAFQIQDNGAAIVNPAPRPTSTAGVLADRLYGVPTGTTDVIGDAERFYGGLAQKARDAGERVETNATLLVIGGLLALWMLTRRGS